MRRKNHWFLFAILLLSLTSLSPGFEFTKSVNNHSPGKDPLPPLQTPDLPESDLGPIQVAVQLSDDELEILKDLNEDFMKRTGAVVEIVPLDTIGVNEQDFIRAMNLGEGPDVLLVDSQWVKSLAVKGLLLPVDASQAVVPDSQPIGGLLPPVQWNGYQWGIPFDIDPYVLVWKIDDSNSELPSNRKAWTAYKKERGDNPVFSLDPQDPYAFAAAVDILGGNPEHPETEVLSLLAPPAGDSWLELSGSETIVKEQEDETPGSASVMITAYSVIHKDLPEDAGIMLGGYPSDKSKVIIKSLSYAVTSQSESSSLAMNWITEMTTRETESEWSRRTGKLSALQSNIDSAINSGVEKNEVIASITSLLEHNEAVSLNFGQDDGFMSYSSSASDLLYGRMTVKQFRALDQQEQASAK